MTATDFRDSLPELVKHGEVAVAAGIPRNRWHVMVARGQDLDDEQQEALASVLDDLAKDVRKVKRKLT